MSEDSNNTQYRYKNAGDAMEKGKIGGMMEVYSLEDTRMTK